MADERILIVEDESIEALELREDLEKMGYEVIGCVASGEEALELIEKDGADLVLMDIKLRGEMNGIEAAGLIRERFGAPIVYYTAYSDEETIKRANGTKPFGYIQKPYEVNSLRRTIEAAIREYNAGGR